MDASRELRDDPHRRRVAELYQHLLALRVVSLVALGIASACGAPADDAVQEATDGDADVRDGVAFEAPLRFRPGSSDAKPELVIVDARIEGGGEGLLVLEGAVLSAGAGALVLPEGAFTRDGARVVPRSTEQIEIPGPGDTPLVLDSFPGRVDALRVDEAARAYLVDHADEVTELPLPLWVSGEALAWPAQGAIIELLEHEDETAHARSPLVAGGVRVGPGTDPGAMDRGDLVAGAWAGAAEGEACTDTEQCDGTLGCVIELSDPAAGGVCGACVPTPTDEDPSPTTLCTDDAGCCDRDQGATCSPNGYCVIPMDDGGDGGGDDGGCGNRACGDRDGDGVKNAWDANPDESCSADADGDGCADSCDSDDDNCLVCSQGRIRAPNSLSVAMIILLLLRGRGRRNGLRRRTPTGRRRRTGKHAGS